MDKLPLDKLIALSRQSELLRPRDLAEHGIARTYLGLAVQRGLLKRVGRGLYTATKAHIIENGSLAEVSKRIPHGVICLLTALRFHEIGTQNPPDVWLAIRSKDRKPTLASPRLRIFRFSEKAMAEGVEKHLIGGVNVPITNPARTVVDCFKYRNKIGLDVALEALRESIKQRKASLNDLWKYGEVCRVSKLMRPYLEAMA